MRGWCWCWRGEEKGKKLRRTPSFLPQTHSLVRRGREQICFSEDPTMHNTDCLLQGLCGNLVPWGLSGAQEVPEETRDQRASRPGHCFGPEWVLSGSCSLGLEGLVGPTSARAGPAVGQRCHLRLCSVSQEGADCRSTRAEGRALLPAVP